MAVLSNLVGRGDYCAVLYFRKRLHYKSSRVVGHVHFPGFSFAAESKIQIN